MTVHHWAEIIAQPLRQYTAFPGNCCKLCAATAPIDAIGRPQCIPVANALVGKLFDIMTQAFEQLCDGADSLGYLEIGGVGAAPHPGRQPNPELLGIALDRLEIGAYRLAHPDKTAAIGDAGQIIISSRRVANRAGDDAIDADPRDVFTLR